MGSKNLHSVGGWAVEDRTYSENEFYMTSVDSKGHQRHVRVNVPPNVYAQLAEAANDDRLPYRSKQDVVRDAVQHRLKWLQDNEEVLEEYVQAGQIARMRARVEQLRAQTQELSSFIETTRETLAEAQRAADYIRVQSITSVLSETLDSVSGPHYEQVKELWKDGQAWLRKFRGEG